MGERSKILIFGASGYFGRYLSKASISMGYPTYAYLRPLRPDNHPSKLQLLKYLQSMGLTIYHGELEEHDKVVSVIKEVDIVISALAVPQHLDQIKIINAIKEAGNVKRFIPSEYGNEVDRVKGALPAFQKLLDNKQRIRRATEEAGIPFTYVSANSFMSYFVSYLLRPHHRNSNHLTLTVYGTGEAKAALNHEEDVAVYTVRAATDPRAANRVIICRPPKNIISQLELVASWEKLIARPIKRNHLSSHQLIALSQEVAFSDNVAIAILHNIFVMGAQLSFELTHHDLEASQLYPDYNYTSIHDFLHRCLLHPPIPTLATFA
uniref:Eugenol synthase 2 n=1 Tax=Ocimum basilicum TaxID=39350 RepID=A0A7S9C1H0_OCIBA|nr:eugenol synthase 2 [Ocimum basilicum]